MSQQKKIWREIADSESVSSDYVNAMMLQKDFEYHIREEVGFKMGDALASSLPHGMQLVEQVIHDKKNFKNGNRLFRLLDKWSLQRLIFLRDAAAAAADGGAAAAADGGAAAADDV